MKSRIPDSREITSLYLLSWLVVLAAFSPSVFGQPAPARALPYFTEPAISPDRSEIAFVSGGDIWTVLAAGGEARLLVSHPANESRPLYSPDGRRLAFISTRTGNGDIYILTLESGDLKRLTFDDSNDQLDAWSADGKWIYFSSSSRDISGMNDIFRVSADGGTPLQVSADRYTTEHFSAPSPDGTAVAFTGHGFGLAQWWRKGHSHIDESEIWVMRFGATPTYERISDGGAKEVWPMWSKDGRSLYYVSDRNGAQNIWAQELGKKARAVTHFTDGRVLWPNISYDGRTIVFNRDFQIWQLDTDSGRASAVNIMRRGASAGAVVEHLRLTEGVADLALSPDGRKVAFEMHGEVFAASAADGGDAARVTFTTAEESQVAWSADSRRLVYVSDRDGPTHLFLYDFATSTETQLTRAAASDDTPRYSPDGKMIAFERGGEEMRVLDVESKQDRVVARGHLERPPLSSDRPFVWSPDSKWIAYVPVGDKLFKNIFVVPAAGGESHAVSFVSNGGNNTVSWSPDGTYLLFDTGQRTEGGQVARVDLIPRTPKFREDQFRDFFKDEPARNRPPVNPGPSPEPQAAPAVTPEGPRRGANPPPPPPKPVEINFEQIRQRLSLLPTGIDVRYQTISPDGKWVLMIAAVANQLNLYVYPLDELSRDPFVARQLTSTQGFKGLAQFSPDSKEVYFIEQGRINILQLDTRVVRPLNVAAEMDVDFAREKLEVFQQAWTYLRDNFFDANFHGANWDEVRAQFAPYIAGARTPDEVRRLITLMLGELNASHLGITGPPAGGGGGPVTGRLGLRFDRGEYESAGALRITEVIPASPAAINNIKVGEYLLAVDGAAINAHANLDELLAYKVGRRTVLMIGAAASGASKREVVLRPVNQGTEKGLLYRSWVEESRAYVARISNGRLGYVHLADMSQGALSQMYLDLDAENHKYEGVVVDVRNNNGGFVNVYAIDVLARRSYFTMTPRGLTTSPSRTVLGQRALELPTVLVTNRHTLSDGEDFTEGYRSLKLGKVVGEPTAGWIIYTSGTTLIDGSNLRLPYDRITAMDGTVMEMHPRPVDLAIDRPLGESYLGKDSQLDAAVSELLKELGPRR